MSTPMQTFPKFLLQSHKHETGALEDKLGDAKNIVVIIPQRINTPIESITVIGTIRKTVNTRLTSMHEPICLTKERGVFIMPRWVSNTPLGWLVVPCKNEYHFQYAMFTKDCTHESENLVLFEWLRHTLTQFSTQHRMYLSLNCYSFNCFGDLTFIYE